MFNTALKFQVQKSSLNCKLYFLLSASISICVPIACMAFFDKMLFHSVSISLFRVNSTQPVFYLMLLQFTFLVFWNILFKFNNKASSIGLF